jgi:hypothetical protein
MGLRYLLMVVLLAVLDWPAAAQDAALPVPAGDKDPVLRLEGRGPLSSVQGVAFAPGGATLYEAGWDKVVRVWRRDAQNGQFTLDPSSTLRIPIGPGDQGVLQAVAISADGAWLAVGGNALLPENAGFRQVGLILPRQSVADPEAQGVVYLFDLRANPPRCRQLRGHRGPVTALAFATIPPGRQPVLLSAGAEPDPQEPMRQRLVLRLWDIVAHTELDWAVGGDFAGIRPWLAVWSVAPDHHKIRAAAAWTSSSFLVWDVGVAPVQQINDPHGREGRSTVLSFLPDREILLTGHFGLPPQGQLPEGFLDSRVAAVPLVPNQSAVVSWAAGRPIPADVKGVPVAQALVSSRPGGPRDLLAIVLQSWTPRDGSSTMLEYRLQLLDLAPERFGSVREQASLWNGPRVQPFIASSPDGDWLAIVGNPENEILVQSVADLLREPARFRKLRGVGESIRAATFVRKGANDWGIRLRRMTQEGPDDLVFDLANRRISPPAADWTVMEARSDDWQTKRVEPYAAAPGQPLYPWYLWIYERGNVVGPGIRIRPDRPSASPNDVWVTAHALLPPGPLPVPIAAIAAYEAGVGPTLALYNGRTGERFRQLSGHTGTIRSLAFSQDGRFLVSAADDRTACIWSLTDLNRILQKSGALPGLVLTKRDDRYVVADILDDSPYRHGVDLQQWDVIEGYVDGQGQLHNLSSALDVHFTAAARLPGETLSLSRRRDSQGAQAVELKLGQAIDERKPLLTLFLAREKPGGPLDWLAWNPFGPYDSSGPGIAALFGWHFNAPERPEAPARFALAADYPQFRRPGLLSDLIREGQYRPPQPLPPPRPDDFQLFLDPPGEPRGDLRLVREPPALLSVEAKEAVSSERIVSISWRSDQGALRPMQALEQFWTADLSTIPLDRKERKLAVEIRPRDSAQPTFELPPQTVLYLPMRPRVRSRVPQGGAALSVDQRRFHFAADVEPARTEKARVTLAHRHGEEVPRVVEYRSDLGAVIHIEATLELKPGDNTIELEAVNEGARDDFRDEETERYGPLTVHYSPKPVERPIIKLESLVLLSEGQAAPSGTIPIREMEPCVVESTSRVRVLGRITAKDKLKRVERQLADNNWKTLDRFVANVGETFGVNEEIELVPDRQTITFRARAGNDDVEAAGEARLAIVYHPDVPVLGTLVATPPGPIVRFGADAQPDPTVELSAEIKGVPERIDRAEVLLNDLPLRKPLTIDPKEKRLLGLVQLSGGPNRIAVRLSNRWHTKDFGPILVDYLRPPRVEPLAVTMRAGRPFAQLSAQVTSMTALTRAEVEVVHQARTAPPAHTYVARREQRAKDVWAVSAEVPLEQGANQIILRTWNEDGASPEQQERLVYEKPVEPKPDVIAETPEERIVVRPAIRLQFRVRSQSPLTRVELISERSSGSPEPLEKFPVEQIARGADGCFELRADCPMLLKPGPNAFKIEAQNAGGVSSVDLLFTYTTPPLRVVIDGVETGAGGGSQVPQPRVEGPPSLPRPLPNSNISLRGRVIWTDVDSMRNSGNPRLQVWVNGFPHVVASLEPVVKGSLERGFRAQVLLSRLKDNEIDLRLRGAPLDVWGDRKFLASCQIVERDWRLHLLVIGIGVEDKKELRDRVITAFKGRLVDAEEGTFKTPAFPSAKLYGLGRADISGPWMIGRLNEIRKAIAMGPRPSNEVVILYYQGGEVIDIDGREPCLRLRPGAGMTDNDAIRLSEIRKRLDQTRGAKLFLLDVTHAPDQAPLILAQAAQWIEDELPFGLLRFSWQEQPDTPDASLAATLQAALQEQITLEEVSVEVDRRTRLLRERYPSLRYLREFNRYFKGLVLGGP